MIYLDAATTLKPTGKVVARANEVLENNWGNVSGSHTISRDAKYVLEEARELVANICGTQPDNIVFTSGATEALNLAIQGYVRANPEAKVFCAKTEHDAVLNTCLSLNAQLLNVDENGLLEIGELDNVKAGDLICVMAVNNETGVVQNLLQISELIKAKGARLLIDAVQSASVFRPDELCEIGDYVIYSGHKLGALQGVGVLILKDRKSILPLSFGGSQEWELRPGTTPAYLCDSFANVFLQRFDKDNYAKEKAAIETLRDEFELLIKNSIGDVIINSSETQRVSHVSSLRIKGIESQMLVTMLDERGICISKGSACASGASTPSHVLVAMGMSDEEALSTVRISFSSDNTSKEIEEAVEKIVECVEILRSFSAKLVKS